MILAVMLALLGAAGDAQENGAEHGAEAPEHEVPIALEHGIMLARTSTRSKERYVNLEVEVWRAVAVKSTSALKGCHRDVIDRDATIVDLQADLQSLKRALVEAPPSATQVAETKTWWAWGLGGVGLGAAVVAWIAISVAH